MTEIFIAHTPEDAGRIAPVADALRGAGYTVTTAADAIDTAALAIIAWSGTGIDPAKGAKLLDQADRAKLQGTYYGLFLDKVELPFGFGGLKSFDLAGGRLPELVEAVRNRLATGEATTQLEQLRIEKRGGPNFVLIGGIVAALLAAAVAAFFLFGKKGGPSDREQIEASFRTIPCAWLGIDPVDNGEKGALALTGVAGDPDKASGAVRSAIQNAKLPIQTVTIDRVARIDPRECAAIDGPIALRKDAGGRLRVTGEPFILDTSVTPHQALVRVQIGLRDADKTMALLGVEPSGKVTWSIPDIEMIRDLRKLDVGLVEKGANSWEFTIYPDHLGWTGLLLVTGDSPLARKPAPGTVQSADDFAKTLVAATAKGTWDAEMTWFRIDPDPTK